MIGGVQLHFLRKLLSYFGRFGPCVIVMTAIYLFSATPGADLPNMGLYDFLVKKGSHMLGYALLAVSYAWAMKEKSPKVLGTALALAFLYSITDEFHQAFISGRHSSALDSGIDTVGASLGLLVFTIIYQYRSKRMDLARG